LRKQDEIPAPRQPVHIAVCDNEEFYLSEIAAVIRESVEPELLDLKTFSDPLQMLDSGEDFRIAVLDIQMPALSGIDLAAELVKRCQDCQIIFVSSYTDYVTEVYDTPHLCFILKSRIREMLPRYLIRAQQTLDRLEGQVLSVDFRGTVSRILEKDILYMERMGRLTSIVGWDGRVHSTPDPIETLLPRLSADSFCRCHASFIVDLRYVQLYDHTEFVMADGKHIPISRAYAANARQSFSRFIGSQI